MSSRAYLGAPERNDGQLSRLLLGNNNNKETKGRKSIYIGLTSGHWTPFKVNRPAAGDFSEIFFSGHGRFAHTALAIPLAGEVLVFVFGGKVFVGQPGQSKTGLRTVSGAMLCTVEGDRICPLPRDPQQPAASAAAEPEPRAYHSAALDPDGLRVVVFGGVHEEEKRYFSETIAYGLDTRSWSMLDTDVSPARRAGATLVYCKGASLEPRMVLFGGARPADGVSFDDVWVLSLDAGQWRLGLTSGAGPSPRSGHSAVVVGRDMFVYGGRRVDGSLMGDMHALDVDRLVWRKVAIPGLCPPARECAALVRVRSGLLLTGGWGASADLPWLNDVWHWKRDGPKTRRVWRRVKFDPPPLPLGEPSSSRAVRVATHRPWTASTPLIGGAPMPSSSFAEHEPATPPLEHPWVYAHALFVLDFVGVSARACVVELIGKPSVRSSSPLTISVKARDRRGRPKSFGGDLFFVVLTDPQATRTIEANDNGDGTYEVTFWPKCTGRHTVNVLCDQEPVLETPLHFSINPGKVSPRHCTVTPSEATFAVSRTAALRLVLRDATGSVSTVANPLQKDGVLFTVDKGNVVFDVVEEDGKPGHYEIACKAGEVGVYRVEVRVRGEMVKGSPLVLRVFADDHEAALHQQDQGSEVLYSANSPKQQQIQQYEEEEEEEEEEDRDSDVDLEVIDDDM
jgi:hypothetical protein